MAAIDRCLIGRRIIPSSSGRIRVALALTGGLSIVWICWRLLFLVSTMFYLAVRAGEKSEEEEGEKEEGWMAVLGVGRALLCAVAESPQQHPTARGHFGHSPSSTQELPRASRSPKGLVRSSPTAGALNPQLPPGGNKPQTRLIPQPWTPSCAPRAAAKPRWCLWGSPEVPSTTRHRSRHNQRPGSAPSPPPSEHNGRGQGRKRGRGEPRSSQGRGIRAVPRDFVLLTTYPATPGSDSRRVPTRRAGTAPRSFVRRACFLTPHVLPAKH